MAIETKTQFVLQNGEKLAGMFEDEEGNLFATTLEDLDSWARDAGWDSGDHFMQDVGTGWTQLNNRWFSTIHDQIFFCDDMEG